MSFGSNSAVANLDLGTYYDLEINNVLSCLTKFCSNLYVLKNTFFLWKAMLPLGTLKGILTQQILQYLYEKSFVETSYVRMCI